jgi:hypothetical protein
MNRMEYGIQDGSNPILSILQSCPKQPPKIIIAKKPRIAKTVETLKHDADKRKNTSTTEYQSVD